jgi:transcriptional regulator with XRE-family HTH domain
MDISNLKQLLSVHGITQTELADILGRDKSVITNLFQGRRQLKAAEAEVIAKHLGVTVAQIMGIREKAGAGFMEPPMLIPFQHEPKRAKKISGVVKKGGQYFLEAQGDVSYSDKAYAIEMPDDSMCLAGIMEGDVLISRLDKNCKAGQVVIAQHYQGRGAKTIVRMYKPPFLVPHSINASFKPLSIDKDDVRLVSPVIKLIRVF